MIKQVTLALIAFALCGNTKAVSTPIVVASAHERAAALTHVPARIKKAKPWHRVARQPARSGGGSTNLPSGGSSFDPKKIWESD
jgi:hypothetical protein